ncbi:hypothetical protein [Luteimonas saliphila]|uniref:hypothetical protein n=1 Tax=Luteimonas saliphila TaxID=2804919 RepID=UPI00192D46A1|nr:hypothetical protein [Luteimonas saliphila]
MDTTDILAGLSPETRSAITSVAARLNAEAEGNTRTFTVDGASYVAKGETEVTRAFWGGADDGFADYEHIDVEAGVLTVLAVLGRNRVNALIDALENP